MTKTKLVVGRVVQWSDVTDHPSVVKISTIALQMRYRKLLNHTHNLGRDWQPQLVNAYLIKNTFKSALITMLQMHYTMFKKCFNFAILIAVLTRYSGYFLSCVLFFSTHERVFVIPFIAWVKCGTGVKRCKHILFRLNSKSSETVT